MAQKENYRRPAEAKDDSYIITGLALTNEFGKRNRTSLGVIGKVAVDCPVSTTLDQGVSIKATDSKHNSIAPQKRKKADDLSK